MKSFENAFKPVDWQSSIAGMSEETYINHLEEVYNTFLDCKTDEGKATLDKYIGTVSTLEEHSAKMVELLKEKVDDIMIVRDTDLLKGYIVVDQMTSSIKYYIDRRLMADLRSSNKAPKSEADVLRVFIKYLGFIPVRYKAASLCDLSRDVSYKFETIKNIMESGDNSDFLSDTIKVQLQAGFINLDYLPNSVKYYFVLRGKHGWYLKADTKRNEIAKNKFFEKLKREQEAEAKEKAESEAEAVEEKGATVEVTD